MKRRNIFSFIAGLFAAGRAKGEIPSGADFWKARLFDVILALESESISVDFNPQSGHTQAIYPKGVMLTKYLWVGHKFWKESVFITERDPKAILELIPRAVKHITEEAEHMKVWYAENQWASEQDNRGYFVIPPDYESVLKANSP